MKERVAFVLYRYPLGVSSMIINSARMFAKNGIEVDIYMDKINFDVSPAAFKEDNVKIILYEPRFADSLFFRLTVFLYSMFSYVLYIKLLFGLIKRWHSCLPPIIINLFYLEDYFFSGWLKKRVNNYAYVFPVEAKALISTLGLKGRIIYYNMEMLDWSEVNPIYGKDKILLKILEVRALQGVDAVVIQNNERAAQFRKINDFQKGMYILPVASMGSPAPGGKDLRLRRKFNITEKTKIAVYSGNIMPWAKCLEIVQSVRNWPEDFCLVLHTWRKGAFESEYGMSIKESAKGLPVYFSDEYLDIEELPAYLSSADAALMFYEAIDTNFVEILFSSNKLAEYLKAGLPVITTDSPVLKQFVEENGIGLTVSSMDELSRALTDIASKGESIRQSVTRCYQDKFRFEKFFRPFFEKLYPVFRK